MGCGWLGLPLAEFLISKNYLVKGSSTTEKKLKTLQEKCIEPYLINLPLNKNEVNLNFFNSKTLLINIPPRSIRTDNEYFSHPDIIETVCKMINDSSIKNIIYISSTSVYKNINGLVTEVGPFDNSKKSQEILQAEKLLIENKNFNTTVLRFGGLYGYGRVPIDKRKELITLGNHRKLNLLHRDYACDIIYQVMEKQLWGKIYNVCEDDHPTQLEFFHQSTFSSEITNYKVDENITDYKIVSNYELRKALGLNLPNKFSQS